MAHYNYISLYLLFLSYLRFVPEVESFTPMGRTAHSSVVADNKLFFFGGVLDNRKYSNEVFYLDLSQSFNMSAPSWNDLTLNTGIPFKHGWGTTSFSDINNEKIIYLYGGAAVDTITNEFITMQNVNALNLNSLTWGIPTVKGNPPEIIRQEIRSVTDNTGKMYIFGGSADYTVGLPTIQFFSDMVIFNIAELSWSINSSPVMSRAAYSATLLSNGNIVYIGGYRRGGQLDISQIDVYDTNSLTWSSKVCILLQIF